MGLWGLGCLWGEVVQGFAARLVAPAGGSVIVHDVIPSSYLALCSVLRSVLSLDVGRVVVVWVARASTCLCHPRSWSPWTRLILDCDEHA